MLSYIHWLFMFICLNSFSWFNNPTHIERNRGILFISVLTCSTDLTVIVMILQFLIIFLKFLRFLRPVLLIASWSWANSSAIPVVQKDFLVPLDLKDGGNILLWSIGYCVQADTAKYARRLQTYISYLFVMQESWPHSLLHQEKEYKFQRILKLLY